MDGSRSLSGVARPTPCERVPDCSLECTRNNCEDLPNQRARLQNVYRLLGSKVEPASQTPRRSASPLQFVWARPFFRNRHELPLTFRIGDLLSELDGEF